MTLVAGRRKQKNRIISQSYTSRAAQNQARRVWHSECKILAMSCVEHTTVAYDGSPLGELCLRRALDMARGSLVAQVHVVCVAEDREGSVRLPTGQTLPHFAAKRWLEEIASSLGRQASNPWRNPTVAVHLLTGDPARCIVDVAYRHHTELIIMGAGGQGGSEPLGSVTQAVLDLSEIPVQLQTHLGHTWQSPRFNAIRFAYVFGGPELKYPGLFARGRRGAANA